MIKEASETGLAVIRKITDLWSAAKADSLIDYTSVARVEPITLIDNDLLFLEALPDVLQSLQSIFSGYYLQAWQISANVGKIEVMRQLDKLNPNRKPLDSAADSLGWLMATESYNDRLPVYHTATAQNPGIALEADKERTQAVLAKDTASTMKELANLSVGKMLAVDVTDGLHTATITVNVRLIASGMPSESLVHILSVGNKDTSVKERYYAWKSGRLEFIKDLIFCQDLIDAHRKELMNDKDGIYRNILARRRNNRLSTLFSGNPSVATASNLAVISSETAERLELEINGKLSNFRTRQQVFEKTYLMIMAVVDKQWGQVTFYHRNIDQPTQLSFSALKSANKGSGPDVAEILKAYRVGSSPSL